VNFDEEEEEIDYGFTKNGTVCKSCLQAKGRGRVHVHK
jgi:hypothetical protein